MQKVKHFLKARFNNDEVTHRAEKSKWENMEKENGPLDLLSDQDLQTVFTHREGKGINVTKIL